ncbi:diguanylate cyclase [Haematospirillum jordaniae]|uniref:Response regulatory domain-containing protein n=1 Tax=Haematospirillum jordaniae TaxID=1549855 RepID=A0A143DFZ5_9PROT|nr:diguanylate cyclase [Haematospirillum jordaniae]AMW35213.1 hypothetical protein AY555_08545 [Haematospirillum jordaniae]NKD45634.1 diguanylate cyclase [Haematospirillum jordaniae]NKD56387.1 diguanylate cyclase [Haematospirillum jordaniae]NKD58445.1 diguanylate cyclase [Haematospirillum jordaniae]NKD66386.1 diguanylate cyclase [Haematospirillum jordaniae]
MIHLATAVVAVRDPQDAASLERHLMADSYDCQHVVAPTDLIGVMKKFQPDVLVLDSAFCGGNPEKIVRTVRADPSFVHLSIFYLTSVPVAEQVDALLKSGIDDAVHWPTSPELILSHIRPMIRVSTMRAELLHRIHVLEHIGKRAVNASLFAPEDISVSAPSILLTGADDTREKILSAFPDAELFVAKDLATATRILEDRFLDAMVMAPSDTVQPWLDLCLQMRRNVRLFNLPVLFINRTPHPVDPQTPLSMGASRVIDGVPVIQDLRFSLHVLIRRQRMRWALRRSLGETLTTGSDADNNMPEVYSRNFLMQSLESRIREAAASSLRNRSHRFSFVTFAFAGLDAMRHDFGEKAEHDLLRQIGQWLTLLVRAEDMVARLTPVNFAVILADTPLDEADVVMQRIAGVIGNTEFAVEDVFRPVSVSPFVGASEVQSGDTVQSLMERARPVFDERSMS